MAKMSPLVRDIRMHTPGILIGTGVGLFAAWFAMQQGADLNSIADAGKGLYDAVFAREANPFETAKLKLYVVFGLVGATLGYIADKIVTRMK